MKFIIFLFSPVLLIACNGNGSRPSDASPKSTFNESADSGVKGNAITKKLELLSDSVSFYRYGLKDTLKEDFNCDGFNDQAFFSSENSIRHINFIDGKDRKRKVFGIDQKIIGDLDANYSWVDFWGITKDSSTWEMLVEDGELSGSRIVRLNCPSIVLRKEEEGGGVITFTKKSYVWIHQAE
jgi:hypothetical protein